MKIIECLKVTYPFQGVCLPEYYLGGRYFKVQKREEGDTITVFARTYISNVCQKMKNGSIYHSRAMKNPIASDAHPEVDDSGMLNHDDHSRYRMLIGCGQWAITLRRFDVMYAIQTMARFSGAPRNISRE